MKIVAIVIALLLSTNASADSMAILISQNLYAQPAPHIDPIRELIDTIDARANIETVEDVDEFEDEELITMVVISSSTRTY